MNQLVEVDRQAVQRVVLRVHRPDDFIHRPRQLPRCGADLVEVFFPLRRIVHVATRRLAQQIDARQARPEVVMDVLGDARPFPLDGPLPFENFHFAAHPAPGAIPDAAAGEQNGARQSQHTEPCRLPEIRQHGEHEGSAGVVPLAIVVAGVDEEAVIAGRYVGIIRHALRPGVNPVRIQLVQTVFEPDFFRRGKTQAGVLKFKAMLSRRNFQAGR